MCLEKCLLPGKPIGLLITLEWIGPAQRVCIREREGENAMSAWASSSVGFPLLFPFDFCSFSHSIVPLLYFLVVKSVTGLTLNMSVPLAFIVASKLYLSSCVVVEVWLSTAPMPL